jgi:hypothetical protein
MRITRHLFFEQFRKIIIFLGSLFLVFFFVERTEIRIESKQVLNTASKVNSGDGNYAYNRDTSCAVVK